MRKIKRRPSLRTSLLLFMLAVLLLTGSLVGVGAHLFRQADFSMIALLGGNISGSAIWATVVVLVFILLGAALTALFSKLALRPIQSVIRAMREVEEGRFHTRIDLKGIREFEELSQRFNKMAQELAGTETMRSDFVNNLSHEFKTPITSIHGFAELLKYSVLSDDEKSEYVDIILAESKRLAELSTNILSLSKYEHIEIVSEKVDFRLDEQIRHSVALLEPKWSAKSITIRAELDEVTFYGNQDLTQQIWLNLLDNAIKFSHTDGAIHIKLCQQNDEICCAIEDNGIGMDAKTAAHIFDKFYQGDLSRKSAGNGLGLAIVKRIAQLCGGRIEVQSELQKGSVFTVFLSN